MSKTTAAAMRAVENLGLVSECADVIDQATGVPELIAACEAMLKLLCDIDIKGYDPPNADVFRRAVCGQAGNALKIAREGRS